MDFESIVVVVDRGKGVVILVSVKPDVHVSVVMLCGCVNVLVDWVAASTVTVGLVVIVYHTFKSLARISHQVGNN